MNRHSFFLSLLFSLFVSPAFANTASVYFNGDILTMEGDSPNYAEALVVRGSDIAFVGDKSKAIALAGKDAKQIDLKGATLLPGFIDSWGHFTLIAQNTLGVNLAYFSAKPPQNKAQLIQKLQKEGKPFNGWLLGNGYADPFLSDGPLTLADLDKAFPTQPLLLSNISTLTGIANSAGLKKLGISKSTKAVSGFIPVDPKTGELTGELIGMPFLEAAAKSIGSYSRDLTFQTYRKAERMYLENGFTTAQSYESTVDDIASMRTAVEKGIVSIDLIALPTFDVVDQLLKTNPNYSFGTYTNGKRGFKVAGIMVPTDGAPQLRLAFMTKPYLISTGFEPNWRGFPYYAQSTIDHYAKLAYEKNIQYFAYSNGDAGIDMTLAALNKAIKETGITENRRTVVSHAMFVRQDQLQQFKEKSILPIMLINHLWMYGDVYEKTVGADRAANQNPLKWVESAGLRVGMHNDTPSSGPSALFSMWTAVNRKTLGGTTLGPDQRISPYRALQGFTSSPAYQYKEEFNKGKLAKGMLADLVVLDQNPLKVDANEIKNIRVLKTIKGGVERYSH
jgi:predicted amidohydrolase YtcJ